MPLTEGSNKERRQEICWTDDYRKRKQQQEVIGNMPLTRDFRETVMARVKSDPAFRGELIVEATNAFLMDETRKRDWLVRHPQ